MRINKYTMRLGSDRLPMMVKETGFNYGDSKTTITCPNDIYFLLKDLGIGDLPEEHAYLFAFNTKGTFTGYFELSHGTMNKSLIDPKAVFTRLLAIGAHGFIIVHNHPSGAVSPSKEDMATCERIKKSSDILNLNMMDFMIIGQEGYLSFNEATMM